MSENSTQQPPAPILRDNGVPLVRRTAPHRPLAPSQALTSMQEQRVAKIVERAQAPLLARIARLEAMIQGEKSPPTDPVVKTTPPAPQEEKPKAKSEQKPAAAPAAAKPAAAKPAAPQLPTATAEISEAAQKIIDRARNQDLRRALVALAKRDVPDDVKLKQMEAALKKHEPQS